jgi:hypothetical protein
MNSVNYLEHGPVNRHYLWAGMKLREVLKHYLVVYDLDQSL